MPGEMLGIMARPGVAKTWLLLYSVVRMWIQGAKVIFISPEMGKEEILLRIIPLVGFRNDMQISNKALRDGTFADVESLGRVLEIFQGYGMFHIENPDSKSGSVSIDALNQMCARYSPDVIAIDGVRLFGTNSRRSSWEDLEEIFYRLQGLAVQRNVAVVVAHQANRGASNTANAPRAQDAAGGDAILKASTYLITVAMDPQYERARFTTLQKSRYSEMDVRRFGIHYSVDIGDIGRPYEIS